MKRRKFFAGLGTAAVAAAIPNMVKAQADRPFAHVPVDYAQVQEEPEEFQELDEALTDEQFEMDIIWA